jgi:DNA-binding response OmpR family regulator
MATPTLPPAQAPKLNFWGASILIVVSNRAELDIIVQIFAGLGSKRLHRAETAEDATRVLEVDEVDLVVVDAALPDMDGFELVKWLRRCPHPTNRITPAILINSRTSAEHVARARDCGANFVVAKPVSPNVLFERAAWISRENRKFVEAEGYIGPDRRFSSMGPPVGTNGRRADDLPAEVGLATTPNLDQSDIDALFKPKRA